MLVLLLQFLVFSPQLQHYGLPLPLLPLVPVNNSACLVVFLFALWDAVFGDEGWVFPDANDRWWAQHPDGRHRMHYIGKSVAVGDGREWESRI